MMLRRCGWLLLAAALLLPGLAQAQTTQQDEAAAKAAIAKVWVEYEAAIEAKDLDRWMALWADGGVQMPPGAPPNIGNAMIRANNAFGDETYDMSIDPKETTIMGDWAYSRGMYTVTITPGDGSAPILVDGKFMTILRKQADGSWKLYRDIFNSNKSAPAG